jgi:hypothetical protein
MKRVNVHLKMMSPDCCGVGNVIVSREQELRVEKLEVHLLGIVSFVMVSEIFEREGPVS